MKREKSQGSRATVSALIPGGRWAATDSSDNDIHTQPRRGGSGQESEFLRALS